MLEIVPEEVEGFFSRPSKRIRAGAMDVVFKALCKGAPSSKLKLFQELVEKIHSGSLVLDDIQDQSHVRRGGPCLHKIIGVEQSINFGCIQFFEPFLDILDGFDFSGAELRLFNCIYFETMTKAFQGQVLDVQTEFYSKGFSNSYQYWEHIARLKTGALFGLAFSSAAIAAKSSTYAKNLYDLGCKFGVLLQAFDDYRSYRVLETGRSLDGKDLEDFKNNKLTFFCAVLSECEGFNQVEQRARGGVLEIEEFQLWIQKVNGFSLVRSKLLHIKKDFFDTLNQRHNYLVPSEESFYDLINCLEGSCK